jgi:hypothetical protein
VNNFVRAAAMDLAPYGIRVNSFTPTAPTPDNPELIAERGAGGVLERPRAHGIGGATGDEEWRRPSRYTGQRAPLVPMGTTGTPTDIGHAVAWMCSDYARLITGCDFVVDGGARARNFAYAPAPASELAGPLPLIPLCRNDGRAIVPASSRGLSTSTSTPSRSPCRTTMTALPMPTSTHSRK